MALLAAVFLTYESWRLLFQQGRRGCRNPGSRSTSGRSHG
jgi:hypothetical protein